MSLLPPIKVGKLQAALHVKAKGSPDYRFYGRKRWPDELAEDHARQRVRQWLRRKHKLRGWSYTRFSDEYLHDELGLTQLRLRDRNVPWAKA